MPFGTSFAPSEIMWKITFYTCARWFALALLMASLLASCVSGAVLFRDKKQLKKNGATTLDYKLWNMPPPVIKSGDKVSVTVWGHPELSIGDVTGQATVTESTGKWLVVDSHGEINLPKIGKVRIAKYNIMEANLILEGRFSQELNNPIVLVRILNHRVTVLGEVIRPNLYDLDNEIVNLVQIIGMAGGLTEYAESRSVEILRKNEKMVVDLTDLDAMQQKNLMLQPDDVIYVPPVKQKTTQKNIEKSAPAISIITSLTVLISLLLK